MMGVDYVALPTLAANTVDAPIVPVAEILATMPT